MPLLDCEVGDEIYRTDDHRLHWTVIGFSTTNGDLYLESERGYATVTSKTEPLWRKCKGVK